MTVTVYVPRETAAVSLGAHEIAEKLDDPEGKELFSSFAEDERRHHDLLEAQYYQMSNKGTIIWGE